MNCFPQKYTLTSLIHNSKCLADVDNGFLQPVGINGETMSPIQDGRKNVWKTKNGWRRKEGSRHVHYVYISL